MDDQAALVSKWYKCVRAMLCKADENEKEIQYHQNAEGEKKQGRRAEHRR
jgi:hypothetical protein